MPWPLLIIGGSYFAGKTLVTHLAENPDYELYVVNRGNRPLHLPGVTELVANRTDPEALRQVLPALSWAAVIDFCGYTAEEITGLLDVLPPGNHARYIFISTVSVFAPTRMLPLTESSPPLTAPVPELGPAADYGYQKHLTEQALLRAGPEKGWSWTILRPAIIYGPENYAPREGYFFNLIINEETIVIPDTELALFQFVSARDMAAVIQTCLENETTRDSDYNLAAPELISYPRYIEVLEEITGEKLPVMTMKISAINDRRLPLPFPLDSHIIVSSEKLIRDTGFCYTSFTEGMRHTWQWYRQQKEHPT